MFMGFRSELPWGECNNDLDPDFASPNCYTVEEAEKCDRDQTFYDRECVPAEDFCAERGWGLYYYNPDYPGRSGRAGPMTQL